MKKKLQVVLSDESWSTLEGLTNEANDGFVNGSITSQTITLTEITTRIVIPNPSKALK